MKIKWVFLFFYSLNIFSASPFDLSPGDAQGIFGLTNLAPPLKLSPEETQRRFKMFDYDHHFKVLSVKKYREKIDLEIFLIKLESINPVDHSPLITEFYWYRSRLAGKPKPKPLIIISPPIMGVDPLEKLIAVAFTSNDPFCNTFIIKYDEDINDKTRPISAISNSFLKSTTQARILLDFAETQKEFIDVTKMACYGMSLGGIMSALFLEVEPRLKAAIIIVGGGNFPEILAYSDQFIVKGYRRARMKAENIKSIDELIKRVRESILFDPLFFASKRAARDVFMVMADKDKAVPTKNQLELWLAFGKPENNNFNDGHFQTMLLNLPKHKPLMEYLKRRLNLE